jgi:hypothetical protein
VTLRQGNLRAAVAACAESLAIQRRVGRVAHPMVLNLLAQLAERLGLLTTSTRLLAAADVQQRAGAWGLGLPEAQQATIARVRDALAETDFAAAWTAGATRTPDAVVDDGLEVVAQLQQLLAQDEAATRPTT